METVRGTFRIFNFVRRIIITKKKKINDTLKKKWRRDVVWYNYTSVRSNTIDDQQKLGLKIKDFGKTF